MNKLKKIQTRKQAVKTKETSRHRLTQNAVFVNVSKSIAHDLIGLERENPERAKQLIELLTLGTNKAAEVQMKLAVTEAENVKYAREVAMASIAHKEGAAKRSSNYQLIGLACCAILTAALFFKEQYGLSVVSILAGVGVSASDAIMKKIFPS